MKLILLTIILALFCANTLKGQGYKGSLFEQCKDAEPSEGGSCNKEEMLRFITQSLLTNMEEIKKRYEVNDVVLSFDVILGHAHDIAMQEKGENQHFWQTVARPSLNNNRIDDFISEKEFKVYCEIPKGADANKYKISITEKGYEIYKVVEEMPRFPGCEDMQTEAEKKSCADAKMRDYIYNNIVYPPEAIENKVNGNVVVQFVIETDGFISEINVVRSIAYGCDQAAIDVIESMNSMEEPWRPGYQRKKPVRVI